MNAKTRRAALEAASRVALGALSLTSLASCGGKTMQAGEFETESAETFAPAPSQQPYPTTSAAPPTTEPPQPMDAGVGPPPAPQDAGSTTLACVGVTLNLDDPEPPPISNADFDCCLSYVLRHGEDDGTRSYANCCAAVVVGVDQDPTRWDQGSAAWNPCCQSGDPDMQNELWGHWLCTPWGPAVPPSLPPELFGVA
jgi:hypothetical protein